VRWRLKLEAKPHTFESCLTFEPNISGVEAMKKLVTAVVFLAVCLLLFSPAVVADPPWNPGGGVIPQTATDPVDDVPWDEIHKPSVWSGNDNNSLVQEPPWWLDALTKYIRLWSLQLVIKGL